MPFEKVETSQVDFPAMEKAILAMWDRTQAFEKLRQKNAGKPKWSFLDGPITANNPMGVHHAWGRTYKDAFQRFFAMTGHELRYQNGFDCQGLWVEVEVEKDLKARGFPMESKRDIENLVPGDPFASIDLFVNECKNRVNRFARVQTDQSIRLGYWMDWDRTDEDWAKSPDDRKSYFTMAEKNNYTIWSFIKKCHNRKLVYRGYDAMPWCPRCGVGISEQEMKEGYKFVEHKAVFVKFPLRDRPGENLLVWTTTPWTLASNVGAAVNPELTYLRVKLKGEIYYVAKGAFKFNRMESTGGDEDEEPTAKKGKREWIDGVPNLKTIEQMFKEKSKEGFEIVGEVKGADMIGWTYDGPFDEVPAQQHDFGFPDELAVVVEKQKWAPKLTCRAAHKVIAWKDVGETEGTGIVHIAPGCGKEDFQLGKEQGLPPVAPLNESGEFLDGFGELTGKSAVDPKTAEFVFFNLQQKDRLFATERYVHKYPHCWRCKTELLFRLVDEWFIDMKWRDEIIKVVDEVEFLPESINGKAREKDWLKNMGDWMISKKRFWGLALPIWVDENDPNDFEVIGSFEELKERAIEGWDKFNGHTPHRPWIDQVKIRNPRTGNAMVRIPDVGNPWLDAGIVPFSTMRSDWFPADMITESFPGQFRNWFYAMLAMSTMMAQKAPTKVILGHALVRDQNGEEMHKSKGNSIEFNGAAETGYELFTPLDSKKKLPGNAIESFDGEAVIDGKPLAVRKGRYKPMGADVIRWMYCRHNPASNINIGPETSDEVRAKVHIKLWNVYAFFCNYARLDGFDPSAQLVKEVRDIDRWILSDLQSLIAEAHKAFTTFNVQSFCLAVETFIDDKVSNWYVRRNRRRFWKAELGADKVAAFQTLYTVIMTITKLIAPVVPFLSESMFQNLRTPTDPESVHLCDYPVVDASLIDEELSAEVDAELRLVSLGMSARNNAKAKVRQPLAELRVKPANDTERNAIRRFAEEIAEELNVKAVTEFAGESRLVTQTAKPNMKTLGAKCGARLQDVRKLIESGDAQIRPLIDGTVSEVTLTFGDDTITLTSGDLTLTAVAESGWFGIVDRGTELALDGRITEELALEGMARDVVRLVQDTRKDANLQVEDRIELVLCSPSERLRTALETHRETIANETLATTLTVGDTEPSDVLKVGKIEGQTLWIGLRKVS